MSAVQVQMLAKIARDLKQMGVAPSSVSATAVVVAGMTVSMVDASIQSPMGGVDGSISPFLGIGVAAPSIIKIKGAAGENTIAGIFVSAADLKVLAVVAHRANDIVVEAGDTSAELARIAGHADLLGMGQ